MSSSATRKSSRPQRQKRSSSLELPKRQSVASAARGRGTASKQARPVAQDGSSRKGGGTRPAFLDNKSNRASAPVTRPQSGREARQARARQVKTEGLVNIVGRVLAVVVVVAVIGLIAYLILRNTSVFEITTIETEPSEHVSVEDIQNLAKIEEGTTLLNVDEEAISNSLKKNPWVESVTITREFPNTLKITINERKVSAVVVMSSRSVAWYLGEGNIWIEPAQIEVSDGQSTDDAALEMASSVGAILITGVPSTVNPVAGATATDDVIAAVDEYLDGFSSDFASQIVSFEATSVDSISCVLSSGIEVSLGSPTNISAKETVIEELISEYSGQITYINVRVPSNPSYRKIDSTNVTSGSGALGGTTSTDSSSTSDTSTTSTTSDTTDSSTTSSDTSSTSTTDSSSSDTSDSSSTSDSETSTTDSSTTSDSSTDSTSASGSTE